MSINIYLDFNKLKNHKETEKHPGKQGPPVLRIGGSIVSYEKGKHYIVSHEIEEDIPALITEMIKEVSLYEIIPPQPKKTAGRYVNKDASAIVDICDRGYSIQIRGKRMEDVRELYRLIRSGKIRPKESWEEEQIRKGDLPTLFRKMFKRDPKRGKRHSRRVTGL